MTAKRRARALPWWLYVIGGAVLSGLVAWRTSGDLVLGAIVALSALLGVGVPVGGVVLVRSRRVPVPPPVQTPGDVHRKDPSEKDRT